MTRIWRGTATALTLAVLSACGGTDEEPEVAVETAEPADQMEGMQGMEGMGGMADTAGMPESGPAAQLKAHMQMMEGASGAELQRMLPEHRQMVANMVAQYSREMREMMPMGEDSEWNQTLEALRQDLRQLPEMSAEDLEAFLPEHQSRIDRLIEMRREMMANM